MGGVYALAIFSSSTVVAIRLEEVQSEVYFSLYLFRARANAISSAELAFEGACDGGRVLAGLGFDHNVSVRWFPKNSGRDTAVILTCQMDIEIGNGFVLILILSRELDTRADLIEAIVELNSRVCDLG